MRSLYFSMYFGYEGLIARCQLASESNRDRAASRREGRQERQGRKKRELSLFEVTICRRSLLKFSLFCV
ncbi:MAG: hypothetical protein V7K40_01190 [Nostoc sp.]